MARADILLPYWGEFSLFKEAVESVLNQTEHDWHLIVIDDCYPTLDAKKYIASIADSRIEYRRNKHNVGITQNFNYCIEAANAQYCVLLGCDDRLMPDYLSTALANIGEADFYQPGVDVINGTGASYLPIVDRVKRILRPRNAGYYSGNQLASYLSNGQWLYFPSIMWKTSTLKKYRFDTQFKVVEDVVLIFSMIIDGAVLFLDNTTTFQYRRFSASVSSREKTKGGIRFKEESAVYKDFAERFMHLGWIRAGLTARLRIISRIHAMLS